MILKFSFEWRSCNWSVAYRMVASFLANYRILSPPLIGEGIACL